MLGYKANLSSVVTLDIKSEADNRFVGPSDLSVPYTNKYMFDPCGKFLRPLKGQ